MSGFSVSLMNNQLHTTGNFSTDVSGTVVGGSAVPMGNVVPGSLSARLALTAATSTITLAARWQVSDDNSTWEDCLLEGADVVAALTDLIIATGTAAIKTVHMGAPDIAYSKKYARVSLVVGVTTGGTSDLYDIKYDWRKPSFQ